MPTTQGPLFSLSAGGSIAASLTYQKSSPGTVARKRPVPSNPRTPAQLTSRALHALLQQTWTDAPNAFRDTWAGVLGRRAMTPATFFISKNLRSLRGQADLSQIVLTWNDGAIPPPTNLILATPGSDIQVIATFPPGLPPASAVLVLGIAVADQDPTAITTIPIRLGADVVPPIDFLIPQPPPGTPWIVAVQIALTTIAGPVLISAPVVGQVS